MRQWRADVCRYARELGIAGKSLVLGSLALAVLGWLVEPARWTLLVLAVGVAIAAGFGAWRKAAYEGDRIDLELQAAEDRISRLGAYQRSLHVLGGNLPLLVQASMALTRAMRQPLGDEAPASDEQIEAATREWLRVFDGAWPALQGCGRLVTDPVREVLHGPGPSRDPIYAKYEAEEIVRALTAVQREVMMG